MTTIAIAVAVVLLAPSFETTPRGDANASADSADRTRHSFTTRVEAEPVAAASPVDELSRTEASIARAAFGPPDVTLEQAIRDVPPAGVPAAGFLLPVA